LLLNIGFYATGKILFAIDKKPEPYYRPEDSSRRRIKLD